jgi:predicted Fe-Mo cluster-binding NifX family protein
MKIAAITEDGKVIHQHFGRAPYYLVVTVEDGQVVQRELRPKLGHAQFSNEPHTHEANSAEHGGEHGFDPAAQSRHAQMAATIEDCEALLCRGMGRGAYLNIQERGIRPVMTDIASIDEAVQAYLDGKIIDRVDRLH